MLAAMSHREEPIEPVALRGGEDRRGRRRLRDRRLPRIGQERIQLGGGERARRQARQDVDEVRFGVDARLVHTAAKSSSAAVQEFHRGGAVPLLMLFEVSV